jgi:4-aminobutyrate aminotransferase
VWDVDGNQFVDFMGGIAVASTGYSHPKVVQAIQAQAEKFLHISSDYYHEGMVHLGEELDEIAPFKGTWRMGIFYFSSSSSADLQRMRRLS